MKCENSYCIYQDHKKCILNDIHIDTSGMCADRVDVDIPDTFLRNAKKKHLKKYNDEP